MLQQFVIQYTPLYYLSSGRLHSSKSQSAFDRFSFQKRVFHVKQKTTSRNFVCHFSMRIIATLHMKTSLKILKYVSLGETRFQKDFQLGLERVSNLVKPGFQRVSE